MQALLVLAALAVIAAVISLVVLRPKHEQYVTLRNMGTQRIRGLVDPQSSATLDEDDNDYTRHGYARHKRRYNFLNRKNTLFND